MNIIDAAPDCMEHVTIASRSFRLGMEAKGNENLARFIDGLSPMLKTLPVGVVNRLAEILNESLAAQARNDFSYLADLLEYQIAPLLETATGQFIQTNLKG